MYKIPRNKTFLIHNGYPHSRHVNKQRARNALGLRSDEILFIFIGRAEVHKGFVILIESLKLLKEQFTNFRCICAGRPESFIAYWNIASEISPFLILPGHLSKSQLKLWLSASDYGLLPSYTEQCSFAALEMMDSNVDIITSNGNGLEEMFQDEKTAFVAQIGNVLEPQQFIDLSFASM